MNYYLIIKMQSSSLKERITSIIEDNQPFGQKKQNMQFIVLDFQGAMRQYDGEITNAFQMIQHTVRRSFSDTQRRLKEAYEANDNQSYKIIAQDSKLSARWNGGNILFNCFSIVQILLVAGEYDLAW